MVTVNFKTLSGNEFSLEIELDSEKISDIHSKIEAGQSLQAEGMKLIYKGRVLKDVSKTLGEEGIVANDCVVVLPGRKKRQKRAKLVEKEEPKNDTSGDPVIEKETTTKTEEKIESKHEEPKKEVTEAPKDPEFEAKVAQLQDMGFEKDQCERCLRAGFGDISVASEYLLSGIPPQLLPVANQTVNAPVHSSGPSSSGQGQFNPLEAMMEQSGAEEPEGQVDSRQLEALFPELNQLRAAIQQNPNLLQPILQTIMQQNPELFQWIQENREAFLAMLNQPPTQQPEQVEPSFSPDSGSGSGGTIRMSPEDKESIDSLIALGFAPMDCLQAYVAFKKDVNLAANFLMEQGLLQESIPQTSTQTSSSSNTGTSSSTTHQQPQSNNEDTNKDQSNEENKDEKKDDDTMKDEKNDDDMKDEEKKDGDQ